MFTGLVEQIGTVASIEDREFGHRLSIKCTGWDEVPCDGASMSISGCCLTVVQTQRKANSLILDFDVVPESFQCTTLGSIQKGDLVNLEQALQPNSKMGGHFVQGHIDCVESIIQIDTQDEGESRLHIGMQTVDVDTVVPKGSITIDGVSLTVASVSPESFEVVLIPTTLKETTLGHRKVGDVVNIETDILARTVVQMMRKSQ